MTQSELTNVFSLVRELSNKETLNQGFYFPQILFFNEKEDCKMDNCIYVGRTVNDQWAYIHIAPVVNAEKAILEISQIDLKMLQNFYLSTLEAAKAVFNQYANQLWEFYVYNVE